MSQLLQPSLHDLVLKGTADEIQKCLERPDLDINIQDEYGNTALHLAVQLGKHEIARLLVSRGALVRLR